MAAAEAVHRVTESEYLAIERVAETRSEFFEGEMFDMVGGTCWHSLIAGNLASELGRRLKGGLFLVFNSQLRLKVEATGLHTYPDLSVVCGEMRFADDQEDTIVNPTLLVEVLSDSTEAYDRGKKFEHYRQISSLRDYLLVSQKDPRAELFTRSDNGGWILREAAGLEAKLAIPSLEITVALSEIFANVKFVRTPIRPPTPRRI